VESESVLSESASSELSDDSSVVLDAVRLAADPEDSDDESTIAAPVR
jgi:hypothetical protein